MYLSTSVTVENYLYIHVHYINYIYKLLLGLYKFCYRLSIKIYAGLFKFIEGEANLTYFRKQSVANLIHVCFVKDQKVLYENTCKFKK